MTTPTCHVIDFETTGVDPREALPVSVAVVAMVPKEAPRVVLSTLVDPGVPIPEDAAKVHGITDVSGAPKWADVAPEVIALLRSARFCAAYNAGYEATILDRAHGSPLRLPWLDPLAWARSEWWGRKGADQPRDADGKPCKRLVSVADFYGVEIDAHNAEADALATAEIMRRMWPMLSGRLDLVGWTRSEAIKQEAWLCKKFGGEPLWPSLYPIGG